MALAVAPLKGLTVDQAKAQPDEVQRAIRKALKRALGKTAEKSTKTPASNEILKSPEARSGGIGKTGRYTDQASRKEVVTCSSAQKALALRDRIIPNFQCETGDVIPHAVNLDLFITDFHRRRQ